MIVITYYYNYDDDVVWGGMCEGAGDEMMMRCRAPSSPLALPRRVMPLQGQRVRNTNCLTCLPYPCCCCCCRCRRPSALSGCLSAVYTSSFCRHAGDKRPLYLWDTPGPLYLCETLLYLLTDVAFLWVPHNISKFRGTAKKLAPC